MSTVVGRVPEQAPTQAERAGWVDRHPWLSFSLLTVFYLGVVFALSSVKLLWLDELITLHIARLNSVHGIYTALQTGADPNPPLIHIAVMFCRRVFGEHAWALRLPATMGYWLGMLGLFLFLKPRMPAAWALTGVVLSMGMGGFDWSYESRSYAVFYGFTMLAFYAWSRLAAAAPRSRTRWVALASMTLALAAGLCTNYFAVLAFFPVGAAELVRTVETFRSRPRRTAGLVRCVDWPVWVAMLLATLPLLLFRPLIKKGIALYAPYAWNKVTVFGALSGYTDMLAQMLGVVFTLVLLVLALELLRNLRAEAQQTVRPRGLTRFATLGTHARDARLLTYGETAGVSVLLAYPWLGYAVASLRGGMLASRFVLPVCLGAATVGVLLAYRLFGPIQRAGVVMLGLALCWFCARESYVGYSYEVQKESFARVLEAIPPPDFPGQPLAVSDNLLMLPLRFYAPPDVAARLVCPIDFPAIMRGRGEASAEVNFWAGRNLVYDFPILPLATLQQETSTYMILTSGREWLVGDLLDHGYTVQPLSVEAHAADMDYQVSPIAHARVVFFRASGDQESEAKSTVTTFTVKENLH